MTGDFTALNRNWAWAKGAGEDQKLVSVSGQRHEQDSLGPGPCPPCCSHQCSALLICCRSGEGNAHPPQPARSPEEHCGLLEQLYQELRPLQLYPQFDLSMSVLPEDFISLFHHSDKKRLLKSHSLVRANLREERVFIAFLFHRTFCLCPPTLPALPETIKHKSTCF